MRVIARNSSFTYRGRPVDVRQIGRELGVRYVLEPWQEMHAMRTTDRHGSLAVTSARAVTTTASKRSGRTRRIGCPVIASEALRMQPGSLALSILNAGYALDVELSAIQEQGRGSETLATGAQHIGRTDIAGTDLPHIAESGAALLHSAC